MTNYDGWLDQDHDGDLECECCGGHRVDSRGNCTECGESLLTECVRCGELVEKLNDSDLCSECEALVEPEEEA